MKKTKRTPERIEPTEAGLLIVLADGTHALVPWKTSKRLREATQEQMRHCRVVGEGTGVTWPDIDEDLLVTWKPPD